MEEITQKMTIRSVVLKTTVYTSQFPLHPKDTSSKLEKSHPNDVFVVNHEFEQYGQKILCVMTEDWSRWTMVNERLVR
jgi:hypothetical protein